MNKIWTFIGGILAGVASVFTAAVVTVEVEGRKGGNDALEERKKLALPKGKTTD